MLKETFIKLISQYSDNDSLKNKLWDEIEKNYSNKKRHYHTLKHLENLLNQLLEVKENIQNWDTILFSVYYHDVVYNTLKTDNEEKSAELAARRMEQLHVPAHVVMECKNQILASKSHTISASGDTNYFTDADLSVLGTGWEIYSEYHQHVRKEYAIYPDIIYKPGRKKVLHHFLDMERIFKTDYFYAKFEAQAKRNLRDGIGIAIEYKLSFNEH